MLLRLAVMVSAFALVLAGQSPDAPKLPSGAQALAVPGSAQLKYHLIAVGKQIYKCDNGAWSKTSTPDVTLYDMDSHLKIRHGAGPSWTTVDGNSSVKANGGTAIHFAAPDGLSIDWLRLDVVPSSGSGELQNVKFIQRLYTGAGKAPSTGCSGQQTFDSPYTAHYYFWVTQ